MHHNDESNVVFLVSQPRSGSTLLQRMLGTHPEVHTTSEPWIMLHPLRALQVGAFTADHDARIAHSALLDFLDGLPDGLQTYYESVRLFAGNLYAQALAGTGASLFLDKTPRYYLILEELAEVFPDARFLLLARNPAAVISSVYRAWVKPDLSRVRKYAADLLVAPSAILRARDNLADRAMWVSYEDLVRSPTAANDRINTFLGIDRTIVGEIAELPHFALGDQTTVYNHRGPHSALLDRWHHELSDPQLWRWVRDYVQSLGTTTVTALGYDPEEINQVLEQHRPRHQPPAIPLTAALESSAPRPYRTK